MENLFRFGAQNHHLMKKSLFYSSILISILFIFSCVPPDPAMVYGWNTPTPPGPGGNITGPRILHKIDSANITHTEYFSTPAGVLEQVKFYKTNNQMAVAYNSNNKVSKMVLTAAAYTMDLDFLYDSAGKITKAILKKNSGGIVAEEAHYWFFYNSAGKLIKLDRKSILAPFSGTFTHYGVVNLTWSGDNVVKASENLAGIIHPDGSLEPLDPMGNMVYKFEDYDSKISPFTTLPYEFRLGMGLLGSLTFYQCSYNNPLKLQMEFFGFPTVTTYGSYIYDTQNYPVSDAAGVSKYIYKPVQ
jgi:hypothetical protein